MIQFGMPDARMGRVAGDARTRVRHPCSLPVPSSRRVPATGGSTLRVLAIGPLLVVAVAAIGTPAELGGGEAEVSAPDSEVGSQEPACEAGDLPMDQLELVSTELSHIGCSGN